MTAMMNEDKEKLMEARKTITIVARALRQVEIFMKGSSCLDERRVRQTIQTALKVADVFEQGKK